MGSLITPAIRGRERNAVRDRPQQGALLIQFTDTTRSNQTEPIDPVEGVDELEQIRLAANSNRRPAAGVAPFTYAWWFLVGGALLAAAMVAALVS